MKNFSLGVLVMLCLGLLIQNNHLHKQIARSAKSSPQTAVAQKTVKPITKKKPTVVAIQQERPENYNEYAGTPPEHDPRCPSHLPYYAGRWGCVVKRP
jgi:hypothetical protein